MLLILGDLGKIAVGGMNAGMLDRLQPFMIPRQYLVIMVEQSDNTLGQLLPQPMIGKTVKHPGAFRQAFHQTGTGQQFDMTADPGLALSQHTDQLTHRQFPLRKQCQYAQARWFPHSPQGGYNMFQGHLRRLILQIYHQIKYKDIFISLFLL